MRKACLLFVLTGLVGLSGLAGGSGAASARSEGPSFDCAKARTPDEKLICASPELSRADVALAESFRALLDAADPADRDAVKTEQRQWVSARNRHCGLAASTRVTGQNRVEFVSCLEREYSGRTRYLDGLRDGLPISAKLVTVRQDERNDRKKYETAVSFPVIQDRSISGAESFNAAMRAFVEPEIARFRKDSEEAAADPDANFPGNLTLEIDYRVAVSAQTLLSIQFTIYEFSGGAHGNTTASTIHYDLKARRALTAADLLTGPAWVRALSDYATKDLHRQARENDWGMPIEDNAVPDVVKDLANWSFGADKASITFTPYTIGAYALGTQVVEVPYRVLKPFLKPGTALASRG